MGDWNPPVVPTVTGAGLTTSTPASPPAVVTHAQCQRDLQSANERIEALQMAARTFMDDHRGTLTDGGCTGPISDGGECEICQALMDLLK